MYHCVPGDIIYMYYVLRLLVFLKAWRIWCAWDRLFGEHLELHRSCLPKYKITWLINNSRKECDNKLVGNQELHHLKNQENINTNDRRKT